MMVRNLPNNYRTIKLALPQVIYRQPGDFPKFGRLMISFPRQALLGDEPGGNESVAGTRRR